MPSENPYESPKVDVQVSAGRHKDRSELETTDWVLAALCSGIACIVGIVWLVQGKQKGLKMVGISLMFAFFWNVVRYVLIAVFQK
ncbi:MAG TPA: hypothetical protein VG826_15930 [Pirellulales bacterium]|nr:hypothetical protein [Pirellulales bacterium]